MLAVLLLPVAAVLSLLGIVTRRGATINLVARKPAFVRRVPVTPTHAATRAGVAVGRCGAT